MYRFLVILTTSLIFHHAQGIAMQAGQPTTVQGYVTTPAGFVGMSSQPTSAGLVSMAPQCPTTSEQSLVASPANTAGFISVSSQPTSTPPQQSSSVSQQTPTGFVVMNSQPLPSTSQLASTATPLSSSPSASPQNQCLQTQAVQIPRALMTPNQKTSWLISKVTKMPEQDATNVDVNNMNICSAYNYFAPYCRGVQVEMTPSGDGRTVTFDTYGYNAKTKNLVHFVNNMALVNNNYYQGEVTNKMELISSSGKRETVTTIPQVVATTQGTPFTIIAMDPNLQWGIFQTCDKKAAWVAFSEDLVNANPDQQFLQTYQNEIESKLNENGIDISQMTNIDLNLYDVNSIMMGTSLLMSVGAGSGSLVGDVDGGIINDVQQRFIKMVCDILT